MTLIPRCDKRAAPNGCEITLSGKEVLQSYSLLNVAVSQAKREREREGSGKKKKKH